MVKNKMRMAIVDFKRVINLDRVFALKPVCKKNMNCLFKFGICSPLLQDRREIWDNARHHYKTSRLDILCLSLIASKASPHHPEGNNFNETKFLTQK